MNSIYNYSLKDLQNYFISKGDKPFRSTQIIEFLYQKKISNFNEITNIKKEAISDLSNDFVIDSLKLIEFKESKDETRKFLFELEDGNLIETVLMKHPYGYSVCVTTQVGCNMGCLFCASGQLKKVRNLKTSEIVLQILEVEKITNIKVTHIVVMGIGEPFDNYDNVLKFIEIVNEPKGLKIGSRHISVSTVGLIEKIKDFSNERFQANLAVSLHAPNNEIRKKIIPTSRKYDIISIIEAIDYYIEKTNRRVTIEYILIDNVNDQKEHALELSKLLKNKLVYVNLIPYNEVIGNDFKRSSQENMKIFFDILKKNNINTTLRFEQGHDIDAACGQLRSKRLNK